MFIACEIAQYKRWIKKEFDIGWNVIQNENVESMRAGQRYDCEWVKEKEDSNATVGL